MCITGRRQARGLVWSSPPTQQSSHTTTRPSSCSAGRPPASAELYSNNGTHTTVRDVADAKDVGEEEDSLVLRVVSSGQRDVDFVAIDFGEAAGGGACGKGRDKSNVQ